LESALRLAEWKKGYQLCSFDITKACYKYKRGTGFPAHPTIINKGYDFTYEVEVSMKIA